ncbi:MAG: 4-(cytidine 5'-diphospho)-2-C-methyl-D-erythritol kinase [Lachnospiraceae bacterium]|nr:4-(cytidine 5'-diphospho)-2-C-methyl-D-erythritol kinase [Lachnospiraceae bacterium]
MKINAYAKINIGLDVLARRPDGYHEVRMVMQTVGLHDEITVETCDEPGISISSDSGKVPLGEDNLIYKAAALIMKEYSLLRGVRIRLTKNIPVAAGLAGGSTDAAATLRAIDRLYGLGLSDDRLCELGVRIGADVPYCLTGGTVLCEGIGEKMTKLDAHPSCTVLLAKPPEGVSTAYVYKHLELDKVTHPDIDAIIDGIRAKNLSAVASHTGNVLESVTIPEHPVIGRIKDIMRNNGAKASLMSGSGPTVFGLFESEDDAKKALGELERSQTDLELIITDIYNPER